MTTRRDIIKSGAGLAAILAASRAAALIRSMTAARFAITNANAPRVPTARDIPYFPDVLCLDAIDNVAFGQHDPTSSRWADLASGNYFALTSDPSWGDDYISGNGSSAIWGTASQNAWDYYLNNIYSTKKLTLEVVSINLNNSGAAIPRLRFTGDYGGMQFYTANNAYGRNVVRPQGYAFGPDNWFRPALGDSAVYFAISGAKGAAANFYRNGVFGMSGGTCNYGFLQKAQLQPRYPTILCPGKLCFVGLHSRDLSASEIAENYAFYKARFNLP